MKHILLFLGVFIITHYSFGQSGFGVEGGIGMSSMHFAPSEYPILYTTASTSSVISAKLNAVADVPLNKHIYFQVSPGLSMKGAQKQFSYYTNDSFNESVHQTLNLLYADVPLTIAFKSGTQGEGRFVAGLGATFSYLLTGRNKLSDYSVYNDTLTYSNTTTAVIKGMVIHAFDLSINTYIGYETPTGVFVHIYYISGFSDIGVGSEVDKNRMWGVSAGYFFGKQRNVNKEADDLIDHSTL